MESEVSAFSLLIPELPGIWGNIDLIVSLEWDLTDDAFRDGSVFNARTYLVAKPSSNFCNTTSPRWQVNLMPPAWSARKDSAI